MSPKMTNHTIKQLENLLDNIFSLQFNMASVRVDGVYPNLTETTVDIENYKEHQAAVSLLSGQQNGKNEN
jgi:hypothetical protein